MSFIKFGASLALAAGILISPALSADEKHQHQHHDHKTANLEIKEAWTRATVKTAKVGGGYVTITNIGTEPEVLVSGSADFASSVQLHEMKLVDDVMRMRPLADGVEILPGQTVTLKPGAEHIMFMGLNQQLQEGSEVTATLKFEKAGEIPITFKVNGLAAKKAGSSHSH